MLLRLAALALFGACFWMRAGRFPVADEVDFVKPIEAWVTSGPAREGLWHAPFYPWLLSLAGKVFGFTLGVLRAPGFFTTLFAAILAERAARHVARRGEEWKCSLVFVLTLLSPFALGSALLLDYDTSLLVASTALYFHLLVRVDSGSFARTVALFGGALALCLMSKETTPLVYPAGLILVLAARMPWARAASWATASGALGVALFLFASWLWCSVYSLPLGAVFEMDLLGLRIHGGMNPGLQRTGLVFSLWNKAVPAFWVGVPLSLAFLALLPRHLRARGGSAGVAVAVTLVLLVYTFALRQMTYYFPKYMAPVLPWLAWLVVVALPVPTLSMRSLALVTAALCAYFALAPDTLLVLYARTPAALALTLAIYLLPFIAWAFARATRKTLLPLSVFCALTSVGLSVGYVARALFSSHEITYWYGETALMEARAKLESWRAAHASGRIYSTVKDLAWAGRDLGARHIPMDNMVAMTEKICSEKEPLLIVTRKREESSLLTAPQLAGFARCLKLGTGRDIVWGSNE